MFLKEWISFQVKNAFVMSPLNKTTIKCEHLFLVFLSLINAIPKPGGLDSRDQSRSRSRFLDLSRPTFENRWECPSCRDQLFFPRSRFLKLRLFNWDLVRQDFYRDRQDKSRLSRLFKIVETSFLKVSRFSRLLRPALWQCRDWESRSRHDRDKSRPPG
jgi:hypothetical protein